MIQEKNVSEHRKFEHPNVLYWIDFEHPKLNSWIRPCWFGQSQRTPNAKKATCVVSTVKVEPENMYPVQPENTYPVQPKMILGYREAPNIIDP